MDNYLSFTVRISTNQRNSILAPFFYWLFDALQTLANQWLPNNHLSMISSNILFLGSFFSQHQPFNTLCIVFSPNPPKIRGISCFQNLDKERGHEKLLRNRGLVERGSPFRNGGFQIVSSVFLQKSMFSLLLDFFCLVNIHTCNH